MDQDVRAVWAHPEKLDLPDVSPIGKTQANQLEQRADTLFADAFRRSAGPRVSFAGHAMADGNRRRAWSRELADLHGRQCATVQGSLFGVTQERQFQSKEVTSGEMRKDGKVEGTYVVVTSHDFAA